ncbi:MAG: hypothetical protein MdMp014T_0061 [Treponematales bacterium]
MVDGGLEREGTGEDRAPTKLAKRPAAERAGDWGEGNEGLCKQAARETTTPRLRTTTPFPVPQSPVPIPPGGPGGRAAPDQEYGQPLYLTSGQPYTGTPVSLIPELRSALYRNSGQACT